MITYRYDFRHCLSKNIKNLKIRLNLDQKTIMCLLSDSADDLQFSLKFLKFEMGGKQSYAGLTEDLLEDYTTLTYLSKGEILHLMKKFNSIDPEKLQLDFQHRFHKDDIMNKFGALKINPFSDRIFRVFSSQEDDCFSFEDLLDLCSVMSAECPTEVKASWAFRIFDLDEDNQISMRDVCEILDRLVALTAVTNTAAGDQFLDEVSKQRIAKMIVDEINFDNSGGISSHEFKYIMTRLPEFQSSFYFRL